MAEQLAELTISPQKCKLEKSSYGIVKSIPANTSVEAESYSNIPKGLYFLQIYSCPRKSEASASYTIDVYINGASVQSYRQQMSVMWYDITTIFIVPLTSNSNSISIKTFSGPALSSMTYNSIELYKIGDL